MRLNDALTRDNVPFTWLAYGWLDPRFPFHATRREATLARFLVQSPHAAEEHDQVLRALLAESANTLLQFDFACAPNAASDHIAYAIVVARGQFEALASLPEVIRDRAVLLEVGKFAPEVVRALG